MPQHSTLAGNYIKFLGYFFAYTTQPAAAPAYLLLFCKIMHLFYPRLLRVV